MKSMLNSLFRSSLYFAISPSSLRKDRHDIEKSVREAKGVTFREFKKSKLLEICLTFLTGNRDLRIKHIAITLGFRRRRDFSRFIKLHWQNAH